MIRVVTLLLLAVPCMAFGEDLPFEFRGARLGMSIDELRTIQFPDIDGSRFHPGIESSIRLVCESDTPRIEPPGVSPVYLEARRRFDALGSNLCSWVVPDAVGKKAYLQVGQGGSERVTYDLYRAPDGVQRLWKIEIGIPESLAPSLLESLTEKFGAPANMEKTAVQNRMGAKFDSFYSKWSNAASTIELTQRTGRLDEGKLVYTHVAYADDYQKKWDEISGPSKL